MEFGQLRIFQAIAEEGSIARAAGRLHRVPSSLPTRLRQLEEQFGVNPFLRGRQRLQLSPAGKVLLDHAARLPALREEARMVVQRGEPVSGFVPDSMYSTMAIYLPPRLAEYRRRYLTVNLQSQTAPSGELVESLLGGRLGAVLAGGPLDFDGLRDLLMFEERMMLITEDGYPPVRDPEDVAGSVVIAFHLCCSYRLPLESQFASVRMSMGWVIEIESYHSTLARVMVGGEVVPMPVSML